MLALDNIFLTCVALYQQRFLRETNDDKPWVDDDEVDNDAAPLLFNRLNEERRNNQVPEGTMGYPRDGTLREATEINDERLTPDRILTHDSRRQMLVEHFE